MKKLRHVTAFALVGWYLLIPPANGTLTSEPPPNWTVRPNEAAPLSKWKIQYSFNTTKECEEAKFKLSLESLTDIKARTPKHPGLDSLFMDNICVASDDPRLVK